MSLVVFRSRGGATWQLADACTACARSIPHAAQLPAPKEPRPARSRPCPVTSPSTVRRQTADCAREGLEPVLTYLDAALAPETSPTVRLFALLCLLRADRDGVARMPRGLLRGWRLADDAIQCVADLTHQCWLRELHDRVTPALCIADGPATAALVTVGRRVRGQLIDHASRFLQQPSLRDLSDAARLAALRNALSRAPVITACTDFEKPEMAHLASNR